jgi:hypothetical protein
MSAMSVAAQETNIYNQILKESLKMDFLKADIPLEIDSSINLQISKDINEENMYRMLFQHRINFLLPNENIIHFEDKTPKLSSAATSFFYTNPKNKSWDKGKFNGDGTFSGEFATKKDILESKATRVMVSIPELILFPVLIAAEAGLIPIENINVPKESEKDKTLKTIKEDVYHIEE